MLGMVADWKVSGLSQIAYSSMRGIKVATLSYWVARSKEQDSNVGNFVPLLPMEQEPTSQIEIIYPTGVRVKVSNNLSLISQLIHL